MQWRLFRQLWEVIRLPFFHSGAGLLLEPRFLPVQQAVIPAVVLGPHQVPLCSWGPCHARRARPLRIYWFMAGGEVSSLSVPGLTPQHQERGNHRLQILDTSPQELVQDSCTERWDTEGLGQEAVFISTSTGPADSHPKAEPQAP